MSTVQNTRRLLKILQLTQHHASAIFRGDKENRPRSYQHGQMQAWARGLLEQLRIKVTVVGTPSEKPCLLVGNHLSYLDIPVLMAESAVVFVAKKELSKWPVFGRGIKSVGTVLVDRECTHSRKGAAEMVAPSILEKNQSVALFPSGTTSLKEEKPWRWGAFLIGKRYDIPIQPFRLRYSPERTAAYIDDDVFLPHLWRLLKTPVLEAEVEFHPPILIDDPREAAQHWWAWSREKLLQL